MDSCPKCGDVPCSTDFFPSRWRYSFDLSSRLLFLFVRTLVLVASYAIVAPPDSAVSVCAHLCSAWPPQPPSSAGLRIPLLSLLVTALGPPPASAVVFLGLALATGLFTAYKLVLRREHFLLRDQGGALRVAVQVNLIDVLHALLFASLGGAYNPMWSATCATAAPLALITSLAAHVAAHHIKDRFKRDPRNHDKVLSMGLWAVVRDPKSMAFVAWRVALATATGAWGFGSYVLLMLAFVFWDTAVLVGKAYMWRRYKRQWERVVEKVPSKMIPGVW